LGYPSREFGRGVVDAEIGDAAVDIHAAEFEVARALRDGCALGFTKGRVLDERIEIDGASEGRQGRQTSDEEEPTEGGGGTFHKGAGVGKFRTPSGVFGFVTSCPTSPFPRANLAGPARPEAFLGAPTAALNHFSCFLRLKPLPYNNLSNKTLPGGRTRLTKFATIVRPLCL
jgi:hypothetical protein